ncbi:uncharacterized protein [Rutidosis leptorrhynchoides]|uniref:uncharacterized protein n=1 Tax=Rutidosis leptorrhynchoides TaxID=125765 RepID=UPI003A9A6306
MKSKKRKPTDSENKNNNKKASKSSRIDSVNKSTELNGETSMKLIEDATPWRNLQLILSLEDKNLDIQTKVELAYKFVKLSCGQVEEDRIQTSEVVSFERVKIFLNDWIQSTLFSSEKKIRDEGVADQFGVSGSCFDSKCWEIFKFCLDNATKRHVSLSSAKDILKVIHCIAKSMKIRDINERELTLYDTMFDCIFSIFTSHGGVSNENLNLWISLVGTVLELVLKIITNKLDDSGQGTAVLNLTCLVLEPFTKFLRLHPNKKNGFQDFVERLLEPLLCLLHVLHGACKLGLMSKLLKLIEEVLCQGLFHPSHIDGFLSVQSLAKYKLSDDGKPKDSKTVTKSYHRHFYDKMAKMAVEKKALALCGEGELFRLFVHCIKRQEGVQVTLSSEIRKSLFDFFVQIMEPFLGDIDGYLRDEVEIGPVLENCSCTIKSINSILITLIEEKVYVRVDDTSEGACANFLKLVCDKIMLLSAKIGQIVASTFDVNSRICKGLVEVVVKELVVCIRYLLEVDYEVLGNDLESLWLLMFSYGTLGHTLTYLQDQSVISEILNLGCHMINLYSELRQVGTSIFALCKAIRSLVSSVRTIEADCSQSSSSILYYESWTTSLRLILCSPDLRLSIHNAVKSIPEGQVSLCIQGLTTDLSESIDWMKGNSENFCQEIVGSGLSEVYALVLDSLMVTSGNSSLVGVSLTDLITVIRPSMSILISQQSDSVHEFVSEVSGCKDETCSAHWIFAFFFHLYMSCRSLYRQAVSLASPNTSKKMSEAIGDPLTAYSGNDWLEKTEIDGGYFFWISQRSVSLLHVIETISKVCIEGSTIDVSPLIFVLNAMILQRLVDLNRLVKSFEYVIKRNDLMISHDDGKGNKRLRKRLSKLTEEATDLVNYLMGHLSLVKKCQLNYPCDIAVAAIDRSSLPSAIWSVLCQNIDVWSMHAAKKKLKMFLSIVLQTSLPYVSTNFKLSGEHNNANKSGNLKAVTGQGISLELISNTMFYEEKFVWKHMASRFVRFLEELVSPLFNNGVDIELQVQPNWPEVIRTLKTPLVVSKSTKRSSKQEVDDPSVRNGGVYTVCETSLNFLSWMPKRCITSKAFTLCATCILNLERVIVGTLLGDNGAHDHYQLLRLLLCCRKTLKNLMATFCEENIGTSQNLLAALHFEGKFPALWLFKSLLSLQHTFSKDEDSQVHDMMVSLTDYTSYAFLTLIKGSSVHASNFLISARKVFQPNVVSTFDQEDSDHSEGDVACKFMIQVAEALQDHSQIIHTSQGETTLYESSSILACFQGFLWGLSSTLSHMDSQNINLKAIFLRRNFEPVDKLKLCIDTYTSFINKFLCDMLLQDDKLLKTEEKSYKLENVDMGWLHINNAFLSSLVDGENVEAVFFLRQLFLAYSAIVRLNLQIKTSVSLNLVNLLLSSSDILLSKFSINTTTPSEFGFVFLDGVGKFLEEFANHLSTTNSTLPTNVYSRLVDLHLKAIGKCISLQGKGATLESHDTESSTKTINDPECAYPSGSSSLDELKNRLRMSFKVLVRKPSESYLSSAVQSIRRALVASGGGKVSSIVAAGIDCLDLILEAITGRKGLSTVKADILGSVGCIFNIIYHLQGPGIFNKNPVSKLVSCADPDPGSVILMCIEVLTKVSGKHALYQMDAYSVAQALTIPATIFQRILIVDNNQSMDDQLIDRQYLIDLYAACCQMLYTFLRHHKRGSLRHISLLQASVSVLLHCLEMVNKDQTVETSYLVWGVQEGIKCGASLRRIYEEIRQQKDFVGQDCRLFLSSYIVVYSGYGPHKAGIIREIDEALRPGVYALIDACSADDLQYLHTVLGEGPCRNTLANLQHDYKLNFQYEGKV